MKNGIKYILFAVTTVFLVACGTTSKEIITRSHGERTDVFSEVKGEETPPKGFVDLVIKASIKTHLEGYYPIESKESLHGKPGYPFVFNIDGQGVLWKVDGQKTTDPFYNEKGERHPEGGTGMRYTTEKRIRLKAGPHTIYFGLPGEKYAVEFKIELTEGRQHALELKPDYNSERNVVEFKPVYRRRRIKRSFQHGISKYEIFFNGNRISK